jgi:hypothetical protein
VSRVRRWHSGQDQEKRQHSHEAEGLRCLRIVGSFSHCAGSLNHAHITTRRLFMRVKIHPENAWEEFGAVRWICEWQEVKIRAVRRIKASAKDGTPDELRQDIDYVWKEYDWPDQANALAFAKRLARSGRTLNGIVIVHKQVVDWLVQEDQIAEWADAGEPVEVRGDE